MVSPGAGRGLHLYGHGYLKAARRPSLLRNKQRACALKRQIFVLNLPPPLQSLSPSLLSSACFGGI